MAASNEQPYNRGRGRYRVSMESVDPICDDPMMDPGHLLEGGTSHQSAAQLS